ncbi:uncharacterized protein [Onthophagus taurus]|uniref:uncharacterized protein n=1 Tax=Onthophagus taurus TaxID=166361 RepID=UPI0039BEAF01
MTVPIKMNALRNCIILGYYIRKRSRNKNRRRYHVHPIIAQRQLQGEFSTLYSKLREHEDKFFDYFRMSIRCFDELVAKFEENIKRQNMFRAPVSPTERVAVTLRFLATGQTFADLHFSYRLGIVTISGIVKEVCANIWNVLQEECLSIPRSEDGWLTIAAGFKHKANLPNCVGCIDGKHVRIIRPEHSGSLFANYKKHYSIVLLAMCDADYRFTYINVGSCGTDSDSSIFKNTTLYTKLHNGEIILPPPTPLPNTTAFGISNKILRPYVRSNMTCKKKVFNYRLSRARIYIESTFGIMTNKFRIFHRPMNTSVPNTIKIVKACCVLHNFVRERDGYREEDTYTIDGLQDLNINRNQVR